MKWMLLISLLAGAAHAESGAEAAANATAQAMHDIVHGEDDNDD